MGALLLLVAAAVVVGGSDEVTVAHEGLPGGFGVVPPTQGGTTTGPVAVPVKPPPPAPFMTQHSVPLDVPSGADLDARSWELVSRLPARHVSAGVWNMRAQVVIIPTDYSQPGLLDETFEGQWPARWSDAGTYVDAGQQITPMMRVRTDGKGGVELLALVRLAYFRPIVRTIWTLSQSGR